MQQKFNFMDQDILKLLYIFLQLNTNSFWSFIAFFGTLAFLSSNVHFHFAFFITLEKSLKLYTKLPKERTFIHDLQFSLVNVFTYCSYLSPLFFSVLSGSYCLRTFKIII